MDVIIHAQSKLICYNKICLYLSYYYLKLALYIYNYIYNVYVYDMCVYILRELRLRYMLRDLNNVA